MNPELKLEVKAIVQDALQKFKKTEGAIDGVKRKTDQAAVSTKKMGGGLNKLKIGLLAAAAAVTVVIRGITKAIKSFTDYGLKIDKANKSTGVAVESLQKWAYIAEQEHGNFETVTRAFAILGQRTIQASQGLATYTREFEHMGISIYDANGEIRAADQIFQDLGTYIKGATNQSEALGHVTNLLGARYAKELIPMLKLSDEELQRLGDEAERLGIVLDQQTITATKKFSDELTKAKKGFEGAAMQLGAKLLPLLNKIPAFLQKLQPVFQKLVEAGGELLEAVIPLVESLLPALMPLLDGLTYAIKGIAAVLKVFTNGINDAVSATKTLWNVIIKGQRMTAEEQEKWAIKSALLTPGDATAKALGFKDREDMRNRLRAIELGAGGMVGPYGEAEGTPGVTPGGTGGVTGAGGEGKAAEKGDPRWWVELQGEIAVTRNYLDRFDEGIAKLEEGFAELDRQVEEAMARIRNNAEVAGTMIGEFLYAGFKGGLEGAWEYIKQLANKIIQSALIQLAVQLVLMLTGQPLAGGSFLGGIGKGILSALGFDDVTADLNAFRSGRDVMRNMLQGMSMVMQTAQPSLAGANAMQPIIHVHNHLDGGLSVVTGLIKSSSSSDRRGLAREVMVDIDKEDQV